MNNSKSALNTASVILLITMGIVLFTIERIKYPLAVALKSGEHLGLPLVLSFLRPTDYILMLAAALGAIWLLRLEWRKGALSVGLTAQPNYAFHLLLLLLLAWFAHSYLHPGILLGGDMSYHIAYIEHQRLALTQGHFTFWDNYFNIGTPCPRPEAALTDVLAALLGYVVGDTYVAVKLLLFTTQVGAGLAMYRLLRFRGLVPFAALIGTAVYSGAWAHLQLFHYKGVLPQALIFVFLPLGFLALDRVAANRQHFSWGWLGLAFVSGLAVISHLTNGLFAGIYMALYAVASLVAGRFDWRRTWPMVTAGFAGLALAAYVIVPIFTETACRPMQMKGTPLIWLHLPDTLIWKYLLVWHNTNTGSGANFWAYVGLSSVLLALFGLYAAWRSRASSQADVKFYRIASLLLLLTPVLDGQHIRQIIFLLFFLSMLTGLGVQFLLERKPGWRHMPALLLVAIFCDLGSTSIQPLARSDKAYFEAAGNYLASHPQEGRTVVGGSWTGRLFISVFGPGPLLASPFQQLGMPCAGFATVFNNYGAVMVKMAESDLNAQGGLSDRTRKLLAMTNIGRIVSDAGDRMDMPRVIKTAVPEGPLGRVVPVLEHSPVVFAPSVFTLDPPVELDREVFWDEDFEPAPIPRARHMMSFLDDLLASMSYDPAQSSAARIAIRSNGAAVPPAFSGQAGPWKHRILDYRVSMLNVKLTLESDRPGYIQLAHAWYPYQTVLHDGKAVTPWQGSINFLVLPVHAGLNSYEVIARDGPIREKLRNLEFGVLLGLLGIGLWVFVRDRRNNRH